MKKTLNLLFALLLPAAVCLPACAEDASLHEESSSSEAAKPAAKKPAPKKKAKKKKPAPVSEYKFTAVEKTETYKFDRKANPIVKQQKKKAPAKKPAAKPAPGATGVGSDASGAEPEVN